MPSPLQILDPHPQAALQSLSPSPVSPPSSQPIYKDMYTHTDGTESQGGMIPPDGGDDRDSTIADLPDASSKFSPLWILKELSYSIHIALKGRQSAPIGVGGSLPPPESSSAQGPISRGSSGLSESLVSSGMFKTRNTHYNNTYIPSWVTTESGKYSMLPQGTLATPAGM